MDHELVGSALVSVSSSCKKPLFRLIQLLKAVLELVKMWVGLITLLLFTLSCQPSPWHDVLFFLINRWGTPFRKGCFLLC